MPVNLDDFRFWLKVERGHSVEECWPWTGARDSHGYGRFRAGSRMMGAHRWIYERMRARIEPTWLQIDHMCSNPPCVNPWHLEPVTREENLARAVRRGPDAVGVVTPARRTEPPSWMYRDWRPEVAVAHPSGICRWVELDAYDLCDEVELREHVELHAAAEQVALTYLAGQGRADRWMS